MTHKKDYCLLLHGLWRTKNSLNLIEKELSKEYKVINIGYPSRKEKVENISENFLKKEIKEKCTDKSRKINFVAHSLGAIIVRHFLANHELKNIGRVVMLAPPNKGSKQADFFSRFRTSNLVLGPALKQMATHKNVFLNSLENPQYEFGIIAGRFDWKVPPEYTKLAGAKDFLIVPKTHTFIMNSRRVINAIKNFLKEGKF